MTSLRLYCTQWPQTCTAVLTIPPLYCTVSTASPAAGARAQVSPTDRRATPPTPPPDSNCDTLSAQKCVQPTVPTCWSLTTTTWQSSGAMRSCMQASRTRDTLSLHPFLLRTVASVQPSEVRPRAPTPGITDTVALAPDTCRPTPASAETVALAPASDTWRGCFDGGGGGGLGESGYVVDGQGRKEGTNEVGGGKGERRTTWSLTDSLTHTGVPAQEGTGVERGGAGKHASGWAVDWRATRWQSMHAGREWPRAGRAASRGWDWRARWESTWCNHHGVTWALRAFAAVSCRRSALLTESPAGFAFWCLRHDGVATPLA
eukprot:Hpha_TRINITY_DN16122_c1_g1::TRINITY_DN16122_c1_g1_i3::g.7280::m.7280